MGDEANLKALLSKGTGIAAMQQTKAFDRNAPDKKQMKEVILFFPDANKLADYAAVLSFGQVEISCLHLTVKARLSDAQIADARLLYEAVPYCAATWEQLERWFDACRKRPLYKVSGYAWTITIRRRRPIH